MSKLTPAHLVPATGVDIRLAKTPTEGFTDNESYTAWLADALEREADARDGDTKDLLMVARDVILKGATPRPNWGLDANAAWAKARQASLKERIHEPFRAALSPMLYTSTLETLRGMRVSTSPDGNRDLTVPTVRRVGHGTITTHSDSHGLCFCVDHGDGDVAWYDPDELTLEDGQRVIDVLGWF